MPISIHALHEESDLSSMTFSSATPTSFQSTLSMRRATDRIPPVTGKRPISIHALHEESDSTLSAAITCGVAFQSTLSMRRATRFVAQHVGHLQFQSTLSMRRATIEIRCGHRLRAISIHALHEESDPNRLLASIMEGGISIHALHEESDECIRPTWVRQTPLFQSTLSMRRATGRFQRTVRTHQYFNPRSP